MQSAKSLSLRAVGLGAIVIVAGSLMVTTLVGVAAISGMLVRGDSPDEITAQLSNSLDLAIFVRIAELAVSIIGGYTAARLANRMPLRHAFAAGVLAALVNRLISLLCGDIEPIWLTALVAMSVAPCAVFGAWLSMPVERASLFETAQR
jgi:hypothetical protein